MNYVVSDLHGEYDKFIQLLEKIKFSDQDTLYILGDVIDRGKDSIKLLQYIMNYKNMKMILGNHEDMGLKSICDDNIGYYNCWMNNGGVSTLSQFDKLDINQKFDIIGYLTGLPLYRIVGDFVLVHAGINQGKYKSIKRLLENQDEETLLWNRPMNLDLPFKEGYKLIFGHSPTSYLYNDGKTPLRIYYNKTKDKIGIDCGCEARKEALNKLFP